MSGNPLDDRITNDGRRFLGLVREHHRVEVGLNDPHQGTYRSHVGGLLDIIDDLLAETTTAQPEADAVERAARAMYEKGAWCGVCDHDGFDACAECRETCTGYAVAALSEGDQTPQPGDAEQAWNEGFEAGHDFREWQVGPTGIPQDPPCNPYRRAALAAAQPVECTRRHLVPVDESRDEWGDAAVQPVEPEPRPRFEWVAVEGVRILMPVSEPDEREALVDDVERILRTSDRDGRALVREVIDVILAAGFRRSQPEVTHTVTAAPNEFADLVDDMMIGVSTGAVPYADLVDALADAITDHRNGAPLRRPAWLGR